MDRNTILTNMISSYKAFSAADSRRTIEKVLKHSGTTSDILNRADIKEEVVLFRFRTGTAIFQINDAKPLEIEQNIETLVFVEQGDTHSIRDVRYERLLDICDQLIDWSTNTDASTINTDVYTLSLASTGDTQETSGYYAATINFRSIIKLQ